MTWSLRDAAGERPLHALTESEAGRWTGRMPPGRLGTTGARGTEDRLGWMDLPLTAASELPDWAALRRDLIAEGFERLVVVAIGGSGACPQTLVSGLPRREGLETRILNSLAPEAVKEAARPDLLPRTVFLVASKSGTTVEIRALESVTVRAVEAAPGSPGRQFFALSDPGSPLLRQAEAAGYRGRFEGKVNVGGRFSALSAFGLLPAALAGCELEEELRAARRVRLALDEETGADDCAFRLGGLLARLAAAGRFQAHLSAAPDRRAMLPWLEQLFSENTGKQDTGIFPVILPPPPRPVSSGRSVLRIHLGTASAADREQFAEFAAAGVPVIHCPANRGGLLADLFRWQITVSVAAFELGVNPYDQPDIEGSKAAARRLAADPASAPEPPAVGGRELRGFLEAAPDGGLVINAFGYRSRRARTALHRMQREIARRFGVVPAVGFGSALLHSLGQIEKGGPPGLGVLMLTWSPEEDLPIPPAAALPPSVAGLGTAAFARLQAAADYEELNRRGRRVLWLDAEVPGEPGLLAMLARIAAS